MKKLAIAAAAAVAAFTLVAGPGGPRPGNGGPGRGAPSRGSAPRHVQPRPSPAPRPAPHPKHDAWGKGGRNFWPGFVGGVIGAAVAPVPPPPPPPAHVVVAPVPPPLPGRVTVWVPECYVDEVQPNGVVVRRWVPGHYEWR